MNNHLRLYLTLTIAVAFVSCSKQGSSSDASEMILFVSIGKQSFQDSINTIRLDGSARNQILNPRGRRSYMYASGNSLESILVVAVHEADNKGQVVDHLFTHNLKSGDWQRLVSMDGLEGEGYLSPDDSRVAFMFAPASEPGRLRPWITDLKTRETKQLAGGSEQDTWDGYLSWRPDGQEVAFLRFRRTPEGLTNTLMRVAASGGEPAPFLEQGESVIAACYAPDGKRLAIFSKAGLEVLESATLQRKVILPWSNIPNAQFRTGGLIWSGAKDKIAFAMFNTKDKQYDLWTVSGDGSNSQIIYSQSESSGQVIVSSFIRK